MNESFLCPRAAEMILFSVPAEAGRMPSLESREEPGHMWLKCSIVTALGR